MNSAFFHTDFMAGMPFLMFFFFLSLKFSLALDPSLYFYFSLVCAVYLNPTLPPPQGSQAPSMRPKNL